MNKDAPRVLQRVVGAWDEAVRGLEKMSQASSVLPKNAFQVFELDAQATDDVVKLNFGPVVFNVPERPNHRGVDLYVVAKGWLTFEGPDFKEEPLRTKNFGTEVGYFRRKGERLDHIYGAHFDMDEEKPGHPVFHVQFGSQQDFGTAVHTHFKRDEAVVDHLGNVLGNVRTPSAQMDIFSVFAQICADHLIWKDSSNDVKKAFAGLRESCAFLVGAAHRLAFLNDAHAAACYRASHWYAAPAANV